MTSGIVLFMVGVLLLIVASSTKGRDVKAESHFIQSLGIGLCIFAVVLILIGGFLIPTETVSPVRSVPSQGTQESPDSSALPSSSTEPDPLSDATPERAVTAPLPDLPSPVNRSPVRAGAQKTLYPRTGRAPGTGKNMQTFEVNLPDFQIVEWRWLVDERGDLDLSYKTVRVEIYSEENLIEVSEQTLPKGTTVSNFRYKSNHPKLRPINVVLKSGNYSNGKCMPTVVVN